MIALILFCKQVKKEKKSHFRKGLFCFSLNLDLFNKNSNNNEKKVLF